MLDCSVQISAYAEESGSDEQSSDALSPDGSTGIRADSRQRLAGVPAALSRAADLLSGAERGVRDTDRARLERAGWWRGICFALPRRRGFSEPVRGSDGGVAGASGILDSRGRT